MQVNLNDPAAKVRVVLSFITHSLKDAHLQDFLPKLKAHLLPRILEIHVAQEKANTSGPQVNTTHTSATDYRDIDDQSLLHELNDVIFKGNRIYRHPLLRLNYTAYDLQRETETVNPRTDHRDIMLLSRANGPKTHPFCYARILGIYHANIIYTGPSSRDYQARRIEFLWVRWFEVLDQPSGWEHLTLDAVRFAPMASTNAFGFVDPTDVLRCCHLIPAFERGKLHSDSIAMSHYARDSEDWKCYYINR